MPHDPAIAAEVNEWLAKARIDLRAAEHERTAEPPITADMVFHAQQLAEKSLKAFLCFHDQPFRKTHSIVELGEQCVKLDRSLEETLQNAAGLGEYAWRFRYPGEIEDPSVEEADEALSLLERSTRKYLPVYPKTCSVHSAGSSSCL